MSLRIWVILLTLFAIAQVATAEYTHRGFSVPATLTADRVAHVQLSDLRALPHLANRSFVKNMTDVAGPYVMYCVFAGLIGLIISLFVHPRYVNKQTALQVGCYAFLIPMIQPAIYYLTHPVTVWQPSLLWVCGFFFLIVPALICVILWLRAKSSLAVH